VSWIGVFGQDPTLTGHRSASSARGGRGGAYRGASGGVEEVREEGERYNAQSGY